MSAVLHCNRAACLMAVMKYREASRDCTIALNIQPAYYKARIRRGRCYARIKIFDESVKDYEAWLSASTPPRCKIPQTRDRIEELAKVSHGSDEPCHAALHNQRNSTPQKLQLKLQLKLTRCRSDGSSGTSKRP